MTLPVGQGYTSQTCAGDLATIAVNFPVYVNADGSIDLTVELRDATTNALIQTASYPTHYTFTRAAAPAVGGIITPLSAAVFSAGRKAWVLRNTKAHQETRLDELQKFPALPVEQGLDRVTAIMQDRERELMRSVRLPIGADVTFDGGAGEPGQAIGRTLGGKLGWLSSITGVIASVFMANAALAESAHAYAKAVTGELTLASFAQARALSGVAAGVHYRLQGANTVGDGGAGDFYYDAASSAADDGGVTTLVTVDGKRLVRPRVGFVRVDASESYTGNGSADDSAALAKAMATGRSVWFPPDKQTVLGNGTALPAKVSGQHFITTSPGGAIATVIQYQTVKVGSLGVPANECGTGGGFRWICPDDRAAYQLVCGRRYVWHKGSTFDEAYQFASMGVPQAQLTISAGTGNYTIGETVTQGSAAGTVASWAGGVLLINWTSIAGFNTAAPVVGGTSGTSRTPATALNNISFYIAENYADVHQKWPFVAVSGVSGTFQVGEQITVGGNYRGTVRYIDGTKLYLQVTSATSIGVGNTVTGATSGATATAASVFRPIHLFQCFNFNGDFISAGTVECAYDGAADGFHGDTNKDGVTVDELWIYKYFARSRRGVSFDEARCTNWHIFADMEGCLEAPIFMRATTAGPKANGSRGWEFGEFSIASVLVGKASQAVANIVLVNQNVNASAGDVRGVVRIKGGEGHGVLIQSETGQLSGANIEVMGVLSPSVTGKCGAYVIDGGGGQIQRLQLPRVTIYGAGSQPLEAAVKISGAPVGEIGPIVTQGSVTSRLAYSGTMPKLLRISEGKSGVRLGGVCPGPTFGAIDMATGAGTKAFTRNGVGGQLGSWTAPYDCWLTSWHAEYSAAPPASSADIAIEVNGSLVASGTNSGTPTQNNNLWPSGAVYIQRGQVVTSYIYGTAGFTTANIDALLSLQVLRTWTDS